MVVIIQKGKIAKNGLVTNKVYYYPTFPLSEIHQHLPKLKLLERMGVEVIYHRQTMDVEKGILDYNKIYQEQLENLEKLISQQ